MIRPIPWCENLNRLWARVLRIADWMDVPDCYFRQPVSRYGEFKSIWVLRKSPKAFFGFSFGLHGTTRSMSRLVHRSLVVRVKQSNKESNSQTVISELNRFQYLLYTSRYIRVEVNMSESPYQSHVGIVINFSESLYPSHYGQSLWSAVVYQSSLLVAASCHYSWAQRLCLRSINEIGQYLECLFEMVI